jgi:hypothetical protein
MVDASRRQFLVLAAGGMAVLVSGHALLSVARAAATDTAALPGQIGGVLVPDTAIARAASEMSRQAGPEFLYNHCMRTYLFGGLLAQSQHVPYDEEIIFVAAALHDLGLVERYSSKDLPFEMDGADAAKSFLENHGVHGDRAEIAWNAIAMHTSALAAHQPAQVSLVGHGAGVDVFGSRIGTLPAKSVDEILAAFPRRGFKVGFQKLLLDYCERKPMAQVGTWTDAYCRAHVHGVQFPEIERGMDRFPYPEK